MDLSRKSKTWVNPEDQTWMGPGRHGEDTAQPILLDAANMLTKYADGHVPSGVEISRNTSTGRYELGAGAVGHDKPGFLLTTQYIDPAAPANVGAALFWHGVVVEAKVPIPAGGSAPVQANHPAIFLV